MSRLYSGRRLGSMVPKECTGRPGVRRAALGGGRVAAERLRVGEGAADGVAKWESLSSRAGRV